MAEQPQTLREIFSLERPKTAFMRWLAKRGIGDPLNQLLYFDAARGKEVLPITRRKEVDGYDLLHRKIQETK